MTADQPNKQAPLSLDQVQKLAGDPPQAASQVIALLLSLENADDELGGWIADTLREVEQVPAELAGEIGALCTHPAPAIAGWACMLATRLEPPHDSLQQPLTTALTQHASISVRQQAAAALSKLPELNATTLTALAAASNSEDARLSRLAQQALNQHNSAV